jgi:hypothetical protein
MPSRFAKAVGRCAEPGRLLERGGGSGLPRYERDAAAAVDPSGDDASNDAADLGVGISPGDVRARLDAEEPLVIGWGRANGGLSTLCDDDGGGGLAGFGVRERETGVRTRGTGGGDATEGDDTGDAARDALSANSRRPRMSCGFNQARETAPGFASSRRSSSNRNRKSSPKSCNSWRASRVSVGRHTTKT